MDVRDLLEGDGDQKLGNYVIMMMRRMGVAAAAVLCVVVSCGQCGILALDSQEGGPSGFTRIFWSHPVFLLLTSK